MKQPRARHSTIRRSVALPGALVAKAMAAAAPDPRRNLNRVVRMALEEYVQRRRQMEFDDAMKRMASDPQVRAETRAIASEFLSAEQDGIR